jgi:hypothetical protein
VEDRLPGLGVGRDAPRIVVVREFRDLKAILVLVRAGRPVLVVLRCPDDVRRRVLDVLAGWALGADGDLDEIGANTVAVRPPGAEPVRLSRHGIVSAVHELFTHDDAQPLTRDEEERLLPLATAGSQDARRRLVDAYAELATTLALWLRPRTVTQSTAVAIAQDELDRLVAWPPRHGTLLAALVDRLAHRLGS